MEFDYSNDLNLTESDYHPHKIVLWAVDEACYFCGYPASHKVTEDYVPSKFITHPMTAYVCCNHFWGGCRNGKGPCPKCNHDKTDHRHIDNWFDGKPGTYCMFNEGMGNPCGCEHYNDATETL